ncbi:hypothetical protein EGW08_003382 [Elysia chlorotica]|uniref:Tyrosine-protein phosphatase domain-containing protein n=1 Tax=Elysia chlorotica TaxID=188477 RepID=A0A3S1BQ59_ELYCH|nr:hypothetical protein EGW08_003382 [Elysia chlorotica]
MCILLQEAEATGEMDFLSTLKTLRLQRTSMVQTVGQYLFLHKLALAAHVTRGTRIPAQEIQARLKVNGYSDEFKAVCEANFLDADDGTSETEPGFNVYLNRRLSANKDKNRVKNILPNDAHRPVLACETKSLGKYINAVFVPNLVSSRLDLLTQLPLPATVTDFWRLVTQFSVGLVVAFDTDSRHSDETVGTFVPDIEGDPIKTDLFEVQAKLTADSSIGQELLVTVFKKRKSILSGAVS